ncbi:MAG: HD domain-containing protein [Candidatus Uhrbacteria bacterium]
MYHEIATTLQPSRRPEHHERSAERNMELEPEALEHLTTLAQEIGRVRQLRALWDKFGNTPTEPPPDMAGTAAVRRDLDDAEKLLRTPELRDPKLARALTNRLATYFSRDDTLKPFTDRVRSLAEYGDSWWTFTRPQFIRADLAGALYRIPITPLAIKSKAFLRVADDPFGALDSDVRDEVLAAAAALPTPELRLAAAERALDIDAQAVIHQLDQFALAPKDEITILRAAAERAPDALPPYLPEIAERRPALAEELLDCVIAHSLRAGLDALDRLPLTPPQRRERERQLITTHPQEFLVHRREALPYLPGHIRQEALTLAVDELSRSLPPNPIVHLETWSNLTENDADIADLIAPHLRRAFKKTAEYFQNDFDNFSKEVLPLYDQTPERFRLSSILEDLAWGAGLKKLDGWESEPSQRAYQFIHGLNDSSSRLRSRLVAALALDRGLIVKTVGIKNELTPTERRAFIEEAMAKKLIKPSTASATLAPNLPPWDLLTFAPRTESERQLINHYLELLAETNKEVYARALTEARLPTKLLRAEIPRLMAMPPDIIEGALRVTDGDNSIILATAPPDLARQIIDRVFGRDDGAAYRVDLIDYVPRRYHAFVAHHLERYAANGIAPYSYIPDGATFIRLADLNSIHEALGTMTDMERQNTGDTLKTFFKRFGTTGERALKTLNPTCLTRQNFPYPTIATLTKILEEKPELWREFELKAKNQTTAVRKPITWQILSHFIPFAEPERLSELLQIWLPRLEPKPRDRKEPIKSDTALLCFRLRTSDLIMRRQLEMIADGQEPIISITEIAHSPDPKRLLTFLTEHKSELVELFADFGNEAWRYKHFLAEHQDPERALDFLRRCANAYATMMPEEERRAKIIKEMILGCRSFQGESAGRVRYASIGSRTVEVASYEPLKRRLPHADITAEGVRPNSLESKELIALLLNRLRRIFREPTDRLLYADAENRALAERLAHGEVTLPEGTLIHRTRLESLHAILREGNLCGEAIGITSVADSYPFFVDSCRVRGADAPSPIADIETRSEYHYEGPLALCYTRRLDPEAAFRGEETSIAPDHLHHLSFAGLPRSELSCIIITSESKPESGQALPPDEFLEQTKTAVVAGDIYVPIVDAQGKILFGSDEFDDLYEKKKPYRSLNELLKNDAALAHLDRSQPWEGHEFTLFRHLIIAQQQARRLAELYRLPEKLRPLVEAAARLHDIAKFEAHEHGQEIMNVNAAERELEKVRWLDQESRRAILILIRHDELLGDVLKETALQPDGSADCTKAGEILIARFHQIFPRPLHRLLMRIVFEADVHAVGNGMYQNWQIAEKLRALEPRLFPTNRI